MATMTSNTSCITETDGFKVVSVCNGSNEIASVMGETPIAFNFTPQDVASITISGNGDMVIEFTSGYFATLVGYTDMIATTGQNEIAYNDGTITPVDAFIAFNDQNDEDTSGTDDQGSFVTVLKPMTGTNSYDLDASTNYATDFTQVDIRETIINEAGNVVITFNDGTETTLTGYQSTKSVGAIPAMTLADGVVVQISDILGTGNAINTNDDIELAVLPTAPEATMFEIAETLNRIDPAAGIAETLAAIEPAAGDAAGPLQNTGAGFGSSVGPANLDPALAVGPIGETELAFNLPELDEERFPILQAPTVPTPDPVVRAPSLVVNNPIIKEDGSGDLFVEATLQSLFTTETLTVIISNLDNSWTVTTGPNNGTYDTTTGTWTITMPAGQNYTGTINLMPPADSDVDMKDIRVQAIATQTNGDTSEVEAFVDATVDAVIDQPTLTANDVTGTSGVAYNLNITNVLSDTDGSETFDNVVISGVPSGFTLSAGTETTPGTWSIPQSDLAGLQINTPDGFLGTFDLDVSVTATDNPTDTEVDTADNSTTVNTVISVDLDIQNASRPIIDLAGTNRVLEDGSVEIPLKVSLGANALPSEFLTITMTGVPAGWAFDVVNTNNVVGIVGDYDAVTGTGFVTLPAGENYEALLKFVPPADSDIDLTGLEFTASSQQPGNGSSSSANATTTIIVDAVADRPDIDITTQSSVVAGQVMDLNISNDLRDTDGSETLGDVTISGLPSGFTLSAGTQQSNGHWVVSQSDLAGLKVTIPQNAVGDVRIVASVTSTESVTDNDFNLGNNTASNEDAVSFTVVQNDEAPDVNMVAVGSNTARVLEDNSVIVPIVATLQGNTTQILTVTLTGIPSDWGIDTGGAGNGTYNPANGTWSITLPQGENYDGGLEFTPPKDSDVDLSGLVLTATAENVVTGNTLQSSTTGNIIVDAVADKPVINANDINGFDGQTIPLDISAALTDTDGSETLSVITISNIPSELNLSQGQKLGNGDWEVSASDLSNLQLIVPRDYSGTTTVNVSVASNETVLDNEYDLTNNTATNTTSFDINIGDRANPPTLDVAGVHQVMEDETLIVPFRATTTGSGAEVLTVSVSGIPSGWDVNTGGAGNGTYNPANGTWSITLPQGENYDGGLQFTPPKDSDVDLTNLRVTAKSEVAATNSVSSITELTTIIVDAVADRPEIDIVAQSSVVAGQVLDLDITNALTDTDGSETLGDVTISGLPSGFTLSAGTKQSNGHWVVSQSDLAGLKVTIPQNAVGDVRIVASVTSTESVTDNDFNLGNNTASNEDAVSFTVVQNDEAPDVNMVAVGSNTARVLEDNSVIVPIVATLQGNTTQILTVTLTGIPSDWDIDTGGAGNGTYNPANGTWSITLPQGENYDGGLEFIPPKDSDVDLSGLVLTATAENVVTGNTLQSSTTGNIIVDAVADKPTLTVQDVSAEEGTTVALDIQQILNDTDGSEIFGQLQISGLPAGASLNKGNETGSGVWVLNANELTGLTIKLPDGTSGTYALNVTSTSVEQVTDKDFDLNNNVATTTAVLNLVVSQDTTPVIIQPASPLSQESDLSTPNNITGKIEADLGNDTNGAVFCIPTNGAFSATGDYTGPLSSNGVPIDVTIINGGTEVVGKAGNVTVFTFTLDSDGDYSYQQFEPLDHASPTNRNEIINLNFSVKVVDGDGDLSPTGTLTVRVRDTGPIARNDVVQMSSCDWVTMGNAVTNYNQLNSGADTLSVETAVIEEVSFNGQTYSFADSNAQSMSVDGQYGTLYIFKTGEYTYVSGQATPKASHTENFSYTLVDQDGDRSTANIQVTVKEETTTSNPLSIYIYDLTNTVIDGQDAYQIQNQNGAFILADDFDDVLAGNSGNDAIFGWDGDDIIYGMGGNDVINGEKDNNILYGGSGADLFKMHTSKSSNDDFDTVKDFSTDEGDVIDIQDLLSGYNNNKDIEDFVRLVDDAGGTMLQVNQDGQGNDFKDVVFISNHSGLNATALTVDGLISNGYVDAY